MVLDPYFLDYVGASASAKPSVVGLLRVHKDVEATEYVIEKYGEAFIREGIDFGRWTGFPEPGMKSGAGE